MVAALTKPGCARIARWCGFGERDGGECARTQRDYVPLKVSRLKSGGYGPGAVRTQSLIGLGTPGQACGCRPGGHGEVLQGSRGDAAGTELGSSFVERVVSEHGNRSGPCPVSRFRRGVWAGSTVDRSVRDGAEPP